MKKTLSKLIYFLLLIITIIPKCTNASANVIGQTLYTDIIASINDYNIRSFNINNYTAIIAEDLINYGFIVNWDDKERTLNITRSNNNNVTSTYIAPKISEELIGKKAVDVLSTDIKTYINGQYVESFNIGGNTIIYFNDLSVFGDIIYDDAIRRLDLDIKDGLNYKISLPINNFDNINGQFDNCLWFELNDSDGGIQVRWVAQNNSNKIILSYSLFYIMRTANGDFAYDIDGDMMFSNKISGPVKSGEKILDCTSRDDSEAYSPYCKYVQLYAINLEYSDGTGERIYYHQVGPRL